MFNIHNLTKTSLNHNIFPTIPAPSSRYTYPTIYTNILLFPLIFIIPRSIPHHSYPWSGYISYFYLYFYPHCSLTSLFCILVLFHYPYSRLYLALCHTIQPPVAFIYFLGDLGHPCHPHSTTHSLPPVPHMLLILAVPH